LNVKKLDAKNQLRDKKSSELGGVVGGKSWNLSV